MRNAFWRVREVLRELHADDGGQDLVEYAFVAVAIALGAAAGMGVVAERINAVFLAVAAKFQTAG